MPKSELSKILKESLADPTLVQSFSGVRTKMGDGPEISRKHEILAQVYACVYAQQALAGLKQATILIGRDPRPTGNALASALALGFLAGSRQCRIRIINMGIITTPLLQAGMRALGASAGAMITASHNPLSDNGFKFLAGTHSDSPPGALAPASTMQKIIEDVKAAANETIPSLVQELTRVSDRDLRKLFAENEESRVKAERAYLDSLGKSWGISPHCLKPLTLGPVLLDPNGGSACGIGARVLEHFGVKALEINAEIGYPEHAIDTDDIDPASGKHMLLRVSRAARRENAAFGIAFDYDADRGNIALPGDDESAIIHPQTVATMGVALALLHWANTTGKKKNRKPAIVASDATSGSCERVAHLFGAEVFIVETGEINVVSRMHELKREGYDVVAGVEGANGGTVFGEATCRDGLQSALCASLADRDESLMRRWTTVLNRNGIHSPKQKDFGLKAILETLPKHFNELLRVEGISASHAEMKARMEEFFRTKGWHELSGVFKSYRFANYEGTGEVTNRTGEESGGWRVELDSDNGKAFIFVRGSRTEASVWRVITDAPTTNQGNLLSRIAVNMVSWASSGSAQFTRRLSATAGPTGPRECNHPGLCR